MSPTRPDLLERLTAAHAARAQAGLARKLRIVEQTRGPHLEVDGRWLLGFASNDYLGLAGHPRLRTALAESAARHGVGATAAHLLGGHTREHQQLEEALADWLERPRALLFSTGYMANLGVVAALLGPGDLAVQDKLDHACLIDGAKLAGAELKRYTHSDVASAARRLAARPDAAALISTDGVFSMDGDIAPLRELALLARAEGATLHVDDAHGLGVLGPQGRGSVAAAGLGVPEVPVLMATLGKALGTFGAFVAGSADTIEGILQFARTYIYTTALPPAVAAAAHAAIGVARFEGWRRDKLATLIAHLKRGALNRGIALAPSVTPIQPLLIGDAGRALRVSRALEAAGFYVPAIRAPTVPPGQSRLRITLSAGHQESNVEALLDALVVALASDTDETPAAPLPRAKRAPRSSTRGLGRKRR